MADVLSLRGGTATTRVTSGANFPARVISTITPDYANGTPIPQVIDGSLTSLSAFQSAMGTILQDFKRRAVNTLAAMYAIDVQGANSDAPLSQLTSGFSTTQALTALIAQMNTTVDSVQSATVSAGSQTAVGTPNGNAIIVVSLKNRQGLTLQLAFPETLTFKCSNDSKSGSATSGSETVNVAGQAAVSDVMSQLWPAGSGTTTSLSTIDGSRSNTAGNMLQNSDFAIATTTNVPDNWTPGVGVASTDIFQSTGTSYTTGGGSVEFLGTGGGLLDGITQAFATTPTATVGAGGTLAALKPSTVYHFNLWYKLTAASPSTGALRVSLIDGSAYPGTVINNDQTVANTATQVLTGVADTDWHNFSGAFQTPAILPTTSPVARIRLSLSTAIESGKGVFIGRFSLTPATALYAGGPFVSIHSGNTILIAGVNPDIWTIAISNNYSTTAHGLMHQFMERCFSLRSLGLMLPAAGSPSVSDALIS